MGNGKFVLCGSEGQRPFLITRNPGNGESPSPTHGEQIGADDQVANDVCEAKAKVDAEFEERHCGTTCGWRSQVGNHRGGKGNATSLEHAQKEAEHDQLGGRGGSW